MCRKLKFFADPQYNDLKIDLPGLPEATYYMQAKLGELDSPFIIQE